MAPERWVGLATAHGLTFDSNERGNHANAKVGTKLKHRVFICTVLMIRGRHRRGAGFLAPKIGACAGHHIPVGQWTLK